MAKLTEMSPDEASCEEHTPGEVDTEFLTQLPLFQAVGKGDWEAAQSILELNPNAIYHKITPCADIPLHVATLLGHIHIVEELIKRMPVKALLLQNLDGLTALAMAACTGDTKIAKLLVSNNSNLLGIKNNAGKTPLILATESGNEEIVRYLYEKTRAEDLDPKKRNGCRDLLTAAISSELYDVAIDVLKRFPQLATVQDDKKGMLALNLLIKKPYTFASGCRLTFWQSCMYLCIPVEFTGANKMHSSKTSRGRIFITQGFHKLMRLLWVFLKQFVSSINEVHDKKLLHLQAQELAKLLLKTKSLQFNSVQHIAYSLLKATKLGIVEIVKEGIRYHPYVLWLGDGKGRNIFQRAISYRQEKIFNLIYETGGYRTMVVTIFDKKRNNMLHLAGMLAPKHKHSSITGAALQMQRELQWFKEVEKIVQPGYKNKVNSEGKIPRELFTEEHMELVKEGEKWMKNIAKSCTVVSTLIATIMFAAAFTVPGGNKSETGIPIFLPAKSFMIFAISDALALFLSTTSVLMFLSILTMRYEEEDFLKSLPKRLIIGLTTLFFSITAMMASFTSTIFIVLGHRLVGLSIPIAILATSPVISFVWVQFPLFVDIVLSTYGPGIFRTESNINFFSLNAFLHKTSRKPSLRWGMI